MEPPSRIVFWQPIASPHQQAFLETLAERCRREHGTDVVLGVERDLPPERAAQGWQRPRHAHLPVVDISVPRHHEALTAHATPRTLHVFSGFFSHPLVWRGFQRLAPTAARLAIYSEAPEQPWHSGWLKRLRGRVLAGRWAGRFSFVLAIGGVGTEFFRRIGFPPEKIVPFGYYGGALPPGPVAAATGDGVVRLVSAGQLIHRKGIDLLVEACATLPACGWRLDVYGDGPERGRLEREARRRGGGDSIVFHGAVSHAVVAAALAQADCAVLPSRFDGWGMLVNEALAVGTPVICTSACGAAAVADAVGGAVVPPGRPALLGAALARVVTAGPVRSDDRHAIRARAAERLSATLAAGRMMEVVRRG